MVDAASTGSPGTSWSRASRGDCARSPTYGSTGPGAHAVRRQHTRAATRGRRGWRLLPVLPI